MCREAEARGDALLSVKIPCDETLRKLKQSLEFFDVNSASSFEMRREEVFLFVIFLTVQETRDIRNPISYGAALLAICSEENGPKVPQELLFNVDFTGKYVVNKPQRAVASKGVAKEKRARRQSVTTKRDKTRNRYGHLMTMVSSAGQLAASVAIVYDRKYKEDKLVLV